MIITNTSVSTLIQSVAMFFLVYVTTRVVYNIFLHPLRSYPGSVLARASVVESQRHNLKGFNHIWLRSLHEKYGPVVRFAPNKLSFIEPTAWKDVYGHKAAAFQKDPELYGPDLYGNPPGLMRADNTNHARQRRLINHAFSDRALQDQEQLLKGYAEVLVEKLTKIAEGPNNEVDLVAWYNYTTFDIMADLTFGEDLGQLRDSKYNPWVGAMFAVVKFISIGHIGREWGLTRLLSLLIPAHVKAKREGHKQFAAEMVDRRLMQKTTRPDIWTYVMKKSEVEGEALSATELHSNGATFMGAGTETTATELSGLTYMLLKSPDKLQHLTKEVRDAFKNFEDITMTKLGQLQYLQACIEEGLRMYPPVPAGLPRVTPPGGATVCGRWIPSGTIVQNTLYSAHRSASNFKNPDTFAPERFLPEGAIEYASDKKDALKPFSSGPRNCVGKNLAYHEMRLVLASMLLHFDLELSPEDGHWMDDQQCFILWEKKPLLVKLKVAT